MPSVLFFIAALGAIAGAIGVVTMRNPFYAVLALVGHLLSLALLFLLLRAEFVAAGQIVVYAGAVMVLYVFVVAYVGDQSAPLHGPGGPGLKAVAALGAGALLVELFIATLGSSLKAIGHAGPDVGAGFGSPEQIGELLLTRFLLAFEAASFLLLVAAVGAVMLARRRRGLALDDETAGLHGMRTVPAGIGSMAEAIGMGAGTVPTPDSSSGTAGIAVPGAPARAGARTGANGTGSGDGAGADERDPAERGGW